MVRDRLDSSAKPIRRIRPGRRRGRTDWSILRAVTSCSNSEKFAAGAAPDFTMSSKNFLNASGCQSGTACICRMIHTRRMRRRDRTSSGMDVCSSNATMPPCPTLAPMACNSSKPNGVSSRCGGIMPASGPPMMTPLIAAHCASRRRFLRQCGARSRRIRFRKDRAGRRAN